jgi:WD40 repeat protein
MQPARIILVLLFLAAASFAQPKDAAEAFTFDPQPKSLEADHGIVQALAYSPNGDQLAVAGDSKTIAIWDVKTRQRIAALDGHGDVIYALAWSADGSTLVSASGDRSAIVWNARTHKPLHVLKHPGGVYAVAISRDASTIATGGFDKVLRLWNADGTEKAKLEGHTASIRCLAFGPDGNELASASSDFTVRLWSLKGDKAREFRGHTKVVRCVTFLGRGLLASGGDDGTVRIWDSADGEERRAFGPFPDGVLSLAASPKGTFLAAGTGNGKIHLLDPIEGQSRGVLNASTDGVAAVAIASTSGELASAGYDRSVRTWSGSAKPAAAALTFAHKTAVRAVCVAPASSIVATGDNDGIIRLLDAATGVEKANWPAHDGAIEDLVFSADGQFLASGGLDKKAKVWRVGDRKLIQLLADHPGPVHRLALSAKGDRLATGSSDTDIRIFDLATLATKKLNADAPLTALQFFADDTLLSAGGAHAYLWDVNESRVLNTLDGGQFARVASAAGSADGKLIAITGEPAVGSQRPEDVGFCRVLAISRHNPTTAEQRMHDTGVGGRIAVSADARIIALIGGDGTLRVWDWPTLAPIRKLTAHNASILGLAVSNRGEFVVTAAADNTAKRWNASRGEPLIYAAKLTDESTQAWFARLSPNGKVLATGGDDKLLRLRDAIPGSFRTIAGEYPCVYSTALSNDGSILATGHLDGAIRLWDYKTGKPIKELKGHNNRVWSLAFSPDGTRLISGGGHWNEKTNGELRIWDTATWKSLHEITAHEDLVFQIAIAPDSKTFATCSRDADVQIWDLGTGKPIQTLRGHSGAVRTIAFSKDGARLYSGGFDGHLKWWDPKTGAQIGDKGLDVAAIERMRLSPDGKSLALALKTGDNQGFPGIVDVETGEFRRQFAKHDGQVNDVAFTPDGKTLISAGGRYNVSPRYQPGPIGPWGISITTQPAGKPPMTRFAPTSEIRFWNIDTGNRIAELPGPKYWVETILTNADGTQLIAVSGVQDRPGDIRIYDLAGIRPKAVLAGHTNGLTCACFSADSTRLATGSIDMSVIIWDVAKALAGDATAKKVLKGHKALVRSVAWSANGAKLISSAEDGSVIIWDAVKGEALLTIAAHDRPVYGVALSPDGSLIATAAGDWRNKKNGEVRIWDAAKGAEVFRLPDAAMPAWGVAFTADGKLIVAYADEAAMRVFDIKTRQEIKMLHAPTAARGLALSPDGKFVGITAQANGLAKIWQLGSWSEAYEWPAHPGKVVFTLDFAADHQTVLTAGGDGAAVVWKMPGGDFKLPDFAPPAPPPPPPPQIDDGIPIPIAK